MLLFTFYNPKGEGGWWENERGYWMKPENLRRWTKLIDIYLMLLSREINIKLCPNYTKIHIYTILYESIGLNRLYSVRKQSKNDYIPQEPENLRFAPIHSCMPSPFNIWFNQDSFMFFFVFVFCLFWTNRNNMAVTSIFLSYYPIRVIVESFNWRYQ